MVQWRATHFPEDAGRPVAADNLHLTLAFLGEVSAEKQRALAAARWSPAPAGLYPDAGRCRTVATFASGVARNPPAAARGMLQLASMLRAQAARSGCYQSPQPFHPHITLWRDARQAVPIPAPGFRWTFPVNEFVLYESSFSRGRTRYTALERYPFDKES
ncbi:RNA 2',3'-cyclic phosphodiesterase [Klebsiella pneumoniae subsp. pneumoniae]|nr:RNA 2',3'-cyclic phosphodiesterase [Klebsiella pneumoniae subsp. pneumoniae]